jgi:hypothetical protein
MSVSNTTNRYAYTGAGTAGPFSFAAPVQAFTDIGVAIQDQVLGTITPLISGTDYTITGTLVPNFGYQGGITITLLTSTNVPGGVLPATSTITLYRMSAAIQNASLPINGQLPSKTIEGAMDEIALSVQRALDLSTRSLKLADGYSPAFNMTLPADMFLNPGANLAINASGNGFAYGPTTASLNAAVTAAQASATAAAGSATTAAATVASLSGLITTPGDIISGNASGVATRTPIGTNGQVLKVNGSGLAAWAADVGFANPMTTSGDTIYGGASGAPTRLPKGTDGQILTLASGSPSWAAAPAGFVNPMSTGGDLIYGGASGTATRLANGTSGQVLTSSGGTAAPTWATNVALTNPMTATGDIIYGGAAGTPTRLPKGTDGYLLTLVTGAPAWVVAPTSGFTNPMTTAGDLILGGASGVAARLPIGSNTYVLTSNGTTAAWAAPATGFTNPMTTAGDLILGGAAGAAGRLPIGTNNYVLTSNGTTAAWAPVALPGTLAISGGGTGATTAVAAFNNLSPISNIGGMIYGNSIGNNVNLTIGANGTVLTAAGGLPTWAAPVAVNLATAVTGILPLVNGGTGVAAASANAAFNALSPLTTKGDIITFGTTNQRLAVPADGGDYIADSNQASGWRAAKYTETQGKPGKNYIQYADFENGATTGWSLGTIGTLTNGLPTGTPTFGSGAAGTLAFTAQGTGALSGAYSGQLAASAATVAGNMLATSAFTVDPSDQAKILTISFNYNVSANPANGNFSGTSSNSFAAAFWDATNSVWIPVVGAFNFVQSSGVGRFTGTLQTNSTTASGRLVVYCANASTGAITMLFDDFSVGPQAALTGVPATDSKAFSGVFTGISSITNQKDFFWRVGDRLFCHGAGTAGSSAASVFTIALPSGLAIDYSKVSNTANTAVVGAIVSEDGTNASAFSTASHGPYLLFTDGSTTGLIYGASSTSSNALSKGNGNNIIVATGSYSYEYNVPITGWSSNVQMSSDTDTRVVAAGAYGAATTSMASGANYFITFPTADFDTSGAITTSANAVTTTKTGWYYTCPVSGYYNVSCNLEWSGATFASTTYTAINLYKNGVAKRQLNLTWGNGSSIYIGNSGNATIYCNAGDYIEIGASQTTGSAQVVLNSSSTNISINRLSGPSVIAASESVNASYWVSANFAASTTVPINFDSKEFDSHNAVTTSATAWKFTAPISGTYCVSGLFYGSNTSVQFNLAKNGTPYKMIAYDATIASGQYTTGTTLIRLNSGDFIDIRPSSSVTVPGGTLVTTTGLITIFRQGN